MALVNWLETAFLSICVVTKKGRHCVQLQISGICIQFNFWDHFVCLTKQKGSNEFANRVDLALRL